MTESETVHPKQRLKELLSIPDSKRSEAQWDELIELEISLAPVNQKSASDRHDAHSNGSGRSRGSRNRPSSGRKKSFSRKPGGNRPAQQSSQGAGD
ncbi:hypothetical protein [Ectothiorhodosinus mongolicus]|uniref:hypothetical protein n=1 Tax=Ectothiorhodosinus mongolicus TaxID=233100 RepID=UPI000978A587|nr:hypothetical protein [Ectothiorhodosinus mongolicus]ULX57175.1 hypothetical protein CKX93_05385 [Ectothiorhodosinus mongolicus]